MIGNKDVVIERVRMTLAVLAQVPMTQDEEARMPGKRRSTTGCRCNY